MSNLSFTARNPLEREALSATHISIAGCGSFGSALADMLVRAGVSSLDLIDPERLAPENVGRHILTSKDVGKWKAEALASRLLEVNPDLKVSARCEKFQDADGVLVCCADSRRCESLVNGVSLAKRTPSLYVGAYGEVRAGEIQVCIPGKTACRECFAAFRGVEDPPPSQERYFDPNFDETRTPGQRGLWGSVLAVAGVAFHAILALLGVRGAIDLDRTLWIVSLDYPGLPPFSLTLARIARGCSVCDEAKVAELTV